MCTFVMTVDLYKPLQSEEIFSRRYSSKISYNGLAFRSFLHLMLYWVHEINRILLTVIYLDHTSVNFDPFTVVMCFMASISHGFFS